MLYSTVLFYDEVTVQLQRLLPGNAMQSLADHFKYTADKKNKWPGTVHGKFLWSSFSLLELAHDVLSIRTPGVTLFLFLKYFCF